MRDSTVCFPDQLGAPRGNRWDPAEKDISMRRIFSTAAFGFGFYYLWNNTDPTTEFLAVGAMGFALLLEFIGAD